MWDKYIKIEAEKYRVRQNSDGTWICIDLKANTVRELDISIGEVNKVLNKYNSGNGKKKTTTTIELKKKPKDDSKENLGGKIQ